MTDKKTRRFLWNSFHFSKVDGSFIGLVRNPEIPKFLEAQPTSKEFSHKKLILWLLRFFDMLLATLLILCTKCPELLVNRINCKILRFNTKVVFFQWRSTFCCTNEMEAEGPFCNKYYPNCTILLEKHYMIEIHRYIQHEINVVSIFVCRFEVRQFQYLGIYRQIRPFENDYHRFKAGFIKKSRHLKYQNAAFQKEQLFHNQVKCNMWPVKMATGHFPTGSHNFAWNGHVDIDGMTTVTLQTNYDPTLPRGNPKVAYPLEISSGSGIYSDAVCHLPAAQHRQCSNRPTTSMLFAVTSSPGHLNHVATIMALHLTPLSFTQIWNIYCPRTIHFS